MLAGPVCCVLHTLSSFGYPGGPGLRPQDDDGAGEVAGEASTQSAGGVRSLERTAGRREESAARPGHTAA